MTASEQLISELKSIPSGIGMYPAAVVAQDGTEYDKRNEFQNGWNSAVMEYGNKIDDAIFRADKEVDKDEMLFMADEYTFRKHEDGSWYVSLSDTWYYASADGENIAPEEKKTVAQWYRKFGRAGALYWVFTKRGHMPQIPMVARMVQMVEMVQSWNAGSK